MRISGLTVPQLEFYRAFCNFSPVEQQLFDLRSKGIPLEECAEIMHYDKIRDLSTKVNKKMIMVNDTDRMNRWIEEVYWKKILGD